MLHMLINKLTFTYIARSVNRFSTKKVSSIIRNLNRSKAKHRNEVTDQRKSKEIREKEKKKQSTALMTNLKIGDKEDVDVRALGEAN